MLKQLYYNSLEHLICKCTFNIYLRRDAKKDKSFLDRIAFNEIFSDSKVTQYMANRKYIKTSKISVMCSLILCV